MSLSSELEIAGCIHLLCQVGSRSGRVRILHRDIVDAEDRLPQCIDVGPEIYRRFVEGCSIQCQALADEERVGLCHVVVVVVVVL
ncbi:MAG TPA: hypothetical protein EYN66_22975 [Myxococcales bacterium]|nr:hypothetical protein [Myxococcales bacterium]